MKFIRIFLVFIVLILLVGCVSAETMNITKFFLSKSYPDQLTPSKITAFTGGNVPDDWITSEFESVIIWVTIQNIPVIYGPVNHTFLLTFNDGSHLLGSVKCDPGLLYYSDLTITLGDKSNKTRYFHLPIVGTVSPQVISYGYDENSGIVYLTLLPSTIAGLTPHEKGELVIDFDTDVILRVDTPTVNPIIRMQSWTDPPISDNKLVWGYTVNASELSFSGDRRGILEVATSVWDSGWGLFGMGFSFFLGFVLPNLFLVLSVGEGILFIWCLRQKSSIPAAIGVWIDKNLYILEICEKIASYLWDFLVAIKTLIFNWI